MDTTLNLEIRITLQPGSPSGRIGDESFILTPPLAPNKPFLVDLIYIQPTQVIMMGYQTNRSNARSTYAFVSSHFLRAIDHAGVEAVGMPLPWIDKITAHIRFLKRTEQLFHYEED